MLVLWKSGVLRDIGCPRLTVHDELDWSQQNGTKRTREAFNYVQHAMEQVIRLRMPVRRIFPAALRGVPSRSGCIGRCVDISIQKGTAAPLKGIRRL